MDNKKELNARKLGAKWEGPYRICQALGKGAYRLFDETTRRYHESGM